VLDEGELRLHLLVGGVGLAHLPTLVLPMEGVQWTLCNSTEGHVVPLGVRAHLCCTFPPAWLLISL
jgi:hypothetical protein